eukprot:CAMPEP_0202051904 /NCGR_PEP_ID=MMETSP0963-20130614/4920_1 /ASSEMBLY_ACC=CAM_ASM_000494 /TAXON_ID=4773 /ORGANISM="Schizochytrium aggregatum, Strain ATCC28209" /LENGTH=264 /DNA_ID=CAMNT_0048617119 /DNA_START=28 /DNA_END=819 /DNA_ORIENTATION=+
MATVQETGIPGRVKVVRPSDTTPGDYQSLLDQVVSLELSRAVGGASAAGDEGGVGSSTSSAVVLRGFRAVFQRWCRTPAVLRVLMDPEFEFEGEINTKSTGASARELLGCEWFRSTFVVPDYSNMKAWTKRAVEESRLGHTTVMIVPARTNTEWFHEQVLEHASDVRFIRGRVTFDGYAKQSPFPDLIAIFRAAPAAAALAGQEQPAEATTPQRAAVDTRRGGRHGGTGRVAILTGYVPGEEAAVLVDTDAAAAAAATADDDED